MPAASAFIAVDRRHNTPGVRVASNPTADVIRLTLHASPPPHNGREQGEGAALLHVTQRSGGATAKWDASRPFPFDLGEGEELWASSDRDVMVWAVER